MKMNFIISLAVVLLLAGCQKEEIGKSGLVRDQFYLENDDAKMHVYLEGNISSDKILVMVHGGPGDGSLYYNIDEATNIAEKNFAVAYWDQRLAGTTQGNISNANIANYLDDLKKLIILLRHRYGQSKKIYLLGHSWGGLLVPLFLQQADNQSLVSGWIQVDGEHNYAMSDSLSRNNLIKFGEQEILAGRNAGDWQKITDYCRDHDPKNNYSVTRKINGHAHDAEDLISDITTGKTTKELIKFFIREYNYPVTTYLSNGVYSNFIKEIDKQAYAQKATENLYKIKVPTLLLWGKYDFVCPPQLADDIKARIGSTDVMTTIFNHSGHSPMFNEPTAFWQSVNQWVMGH